MDARLPQEPLALDRAAAMKLSVSCLRSLGDALFWIEGRPDLGGARVVVSAQPHGRPSIVSPAGLSLSSRVHEYGGGALCVVDRDGSALLVGVRAEDQAIVAFTAGADAEMVVHPSDDEAFGDLVEGPDGTVLAVRERHLEGRVERDIVVVDLSSGRLTSIVSGRDFFSDPRLADDGRFAWCAWDHPSMPWEGSEAWMGRLISADGDHHVVDVAHAAGGTRGPASCPVLVDGGALVVALEDGAGAQLCRVDVGAGPVRLSASPGEVGQPLWALGTTSVVATDRGLTCIHRVEGRSEVADLVDGSLVPVAGQIGAAAELVATTSGVGVLGTSDVALGFVAWVGEGGVEASCSLGPEIAGPLAVAEPVSVRCVDGRDVHGLVYRPHPEVDRPPVVVFCHGGPTAQALPGFSPLIEALASRGFCVVAANYAGSTGFGPDYRHRLDGRWGLADVADVADLVAGLAAAGIVDGDRAAIRGTSAGGFTALLGLTTGAFRAAVSWYGVADLETLAQSTHDFESRYLDRLVGPLPEAADRYVDRSPVTRAAEMVGAALLLQGLDDPIVPPAQAAAMARALEANGHPVELIEFEGESHGFRRLDTLVAAFEAEVAFYERHLRPEVAAGSIRPL